MSETNVTQSDTDPLKNAEGWNHVIPLQIEHTSRLDFIWKEKFKMERDEIETMGSLNKILLENILPAHVADHFLKSGRRFSEVRSQFSRYTCINSN